MADLQNNQHTISSSLPVNRSSLTFNERPQMDTAKALEVTKMLMRLAVTYYRPDFSEAQARVMIADYLLDLAEFEPCDIEMAIANYRKMPNAEFFPKPGILFRLSDGARTMREVKGRVQKATEASGPGYKPPAKSRPIMWWMLPRAIWKPEWAESEAPDGAYVRDKDSGDYRPAYRFG